MRTAALCCLLLGCGASADTEGDLRIGLLLPYTGKDGAAGPNYERGVLMAAGQINAAGGLLGRPLRITYADTHSSLDRGLAGAQTLVDEHVVAIIGPENDELARTLSPMLDKAGVALVTPSSSSPPVASSDANLWFRLAPSAKELGIALARRIQAAGAVRIAIVSTPAEYEMSFATGIEDRLRSLGSSSVASEVISSGAPNFTETINTVVNAKPDAIVLAADASTGSRFANDFAVVAGRTGIPWYLSPTLEQQGFVLNSFPEVVEGMVGVAPAVSDNVLQIRAFDGAFSQRWGGSTPTTGAYFYYDALALFAIAFGGAASESHGATPSSEAVRQHMLSASGQSGLVIEWSELPKGIARAGQGTAVYYSGLTGVISLDSSGARSTAYTRFWTISNGQIVAAPH